MKINLYKILLITIIFISILFRIIVIEKIPVRDEYQIDLKIGSPITVEDYDKALDLNNYKDRQKKGHFYYILYLFKNHKLCDNVDGQLYHPPLHYIITATFLSFLDKFPLNSMQKVEGLQYIGLIYFIISLVIIYKLLNKLELKDKSKLLIFLLYSFFPIFLKMTTYLTNDYLVFIFELFTILILINWNKNPSYKNTILLSIAFGLGNMTKFNNVIMAFPIGICILNKIIQKRKNFSEMMQLITKIIIFTSIGMFLSLIYLVRCLIVLKTYSIAMPLDELYIGDASFWNMWGLDLKNFVLFGKDSVKNVWIGFLYTSLVYNYDMRIFIGSIDIIILIFLFIYFIKYAFKEKNKNMKLILFTFICCFISYICYNIKLPYRCTYDARYILICLFLSNVFLGKLFEKINNKKLSYIYVFVIFLFCLICSVQFL